VSAIFNNPEMLRNARIQLRPGRAIAAVVICAAVSLTTWYSYDSHSVMGSPIANSIAMFRFILQLQIVVLLIGGGIYELLSVHREKELNTFDYQRVTRLTSFELAIGKLFGAPALMYFITLCLMPIALLGAIQGHLPILLVVEAYIILLVGCIVFHLLALLISMTLGRGVSAIAVLPYLVLVAFTSVDLFAAQFTYLAEDASTWAVHQLNPFAASALFETSFSRGEVLKDRFFGVSVPHFTVLMVIYVTLVAWFLLAIVRNLKRDPAVYELYSPIQAFGFAIYLNALMLGFFNWKAPLGLPIINSLGRITGFYTLPPLLVERPLLYNTFWLFILLGLVLLRNREQVRRRIKTLGESAASLWAAFWPAPYLVLGVTVVGIAILELIRTYRGLPPDQWNWGLAILNVAFIALWVARDLLYLQWMGLRRARRPLFAAVLYLIVFYICITVILGVAHTWARATVAAFGAALVPSGASYLDVEGWTAHSRLWICALILLAAQVVLFALLQWQKLREFLAPAVETAPVVATRKPSLMPR
jgi:hypothetical protein